jgi:hypothetical protein
MKIPNVTCTKVWRQFGPSAESICPSSSVASAAIVSGAFAVTARAAFLAIVSGAFVAIFNFTFRQHFQSALARELQLRVGSMFYWD